MLRRKQGNWRGRVEARWPTCLVAPLFALVACGSRSEGGFGPTGDVALVSNTGLSLSFPAAKDDAVNAPVWLSETGAFEDLATLTVAAGLLPYEVQNPLWSDGAHKQRWIAVPPDARIGFADSEPWSFPEGTVLAKHFSVALDERDREQLHHLETRFLVAAADGEFYGLVYKWEEDQSDARLLVEGAEENLEIVAADGSLRQQTYSYPSQSSCGACHSESAGFVMGVRTAQLNGEGPAEAGSTDNQLVAWSEAGLFEAPVEASALESYPRLSALEDETAPLEERIRSYWDSNCSMCHNPASPVQSWDARYSTPLAEQRVLLAEPRTAPREEGVRLVVPGEPERSLMYLRAASIEPGIRMPPLLRNRVDERYVTLLERWIAELGG